jgi:hypothetical protein
VRPFAFPMALSFVQGERRDARGEWRGACVEPALGTADEGELGAHRETHSAPATGRGSDRLTWVASGAG